MENIIEVEVSNIKPNPKNPRIIKDEKFAKLKRSIIEFPDMLRKRPLICFTDTDKKFVVIGGNMRLKVAKDIGLKTVPVILADGWTEEQKNEFIIKDNVGFGEWGWQDLANEWDSEKLMEWGLDIPNFDNQEDELNDLSDKIKNDFRIEIILKSEEEQGKTYNELIEKGYSCILK